MNGWRYAGLQADHILVPDHGRAQLIDFARAQGPERADVQLAVIGCGALAHFIAPEEAAESLTTPAEHHFTLTTEAEV
jgi:hypothetical protein